MRALVNDLVRPIGTYLYRRRLYETMVLWETASTGADEPPVARDFAEIWSANTRIERVFDPERVHRLKAAASRDILIGGAELAGQALATV